MNDELRTKLKEILKALLVLAVHGYGVSEDVNPFVDEIVQAFKNEGWLELHTMAHVAESMRSVITYSLTPDQWLSRFTKELESMQPLMSPAGYEKFKKHALAVAERVVG